MITQCEQCKQAFEEAAALLNEGDVNKLAEWLTAQRDKPPHEDCELQRRIGRLAPRDPRKSRRF